ncbi:MAG TPA: hypothetical protein PK147_03875 [Saprospiraceae bacterium]|nr:hypothetical protein [Saprospiraceae bacterium]MCB9329064.1 hypothetical protein [Lewinellaceae bacterium]HPK10946.1 hypothetical protein [Saprospiraceae bacterium]HPQ20962.1 hypothetical protein [Saprospiraceae bacterium]HRX29090.1 hypothetical protein [Saprospiraceae bacterium]
MKILNLLLLVLVIGMVSSCSKEKGCKNPNAENYNPNADEDDGSCIIRGCTDPESLTYDPTANTADSVACKYYKDFWIGTWDLNLACTNTLLQNLNSQSFELVIEESTLGNNYVKLKLNNTLINTDAVDVEINAFTLFYDPPAVQVPIFGSNYAVNTNSTLIINQTGTELLPGSTMTISIEDSPFPLTDNCPITGTKR